MNAKIECNFKKRPLIKRAAHRRLAVSFEIEAWNESVNVGDLVCLHRDNGEIVRTKTISEASEMGGSAVAWFEGVSGCYAIRCAHKVSPTPNEAARSASETESKS